jgi:CHAT domain
MIPYRDTIWDFAPETLSPKPQESEARAAFRLRVYDSEMALFGQISSRPLLMEYSVQLSLGLGSSRRIGVERRMQRPFDRQSLQDAGQSLWRELPSEATSALRNANRSGNFVTRLKISSNDRRINDFPWEWLSEKENYSERPSFAIVRSVPVLASAPPLSVTPPLKVLVAVAQPKDMPPAGLQDELAAVESGLRNARMDLQILSHATPAELQRVLHEFQPHILHYVGHASAGWDRASIGFQDNFGASHWVSLTSFAPSLPLSLRLVCLSGRSECQPNAFSSVAHAPAELKLPTTVYNQYDTSETGARAFWNTFYARFVPSEADVTEAFVSAQKATAVIAPGADRGAFVLVMRDGCDRPFRFDGLGVKDRVAKELQAQFAALSVNKLAEKVRVLGTLASDSQRQVLLEEFGRASDLLKRLM